MRSGLLPLLFLSLLLLPIGANLVPSAQSSTFYNWAISAYSPNLSGYSNYTVVFMKFSYFPLNDSGFYSVLEMLNIPLQATGTLTISTTYKGITYVNKIQFNEIAIQLVLSHFPNGTYYLDTNVVIFTLNGPVFYFISTVPVQYSPYNSFTIMAYSQGNTWYGKFGYNGSYIDFPLTPIYPGKTLTQKIGNTTYTATFNTVPSTATYIQYYVQSNLYVSYPNVALEVWAPSQSSFTNANPYFVTLFKLYVNGKPYQAPWNGQNLISASSPASSDNGAMIGDSAPPSVMAWGASEYVAKMTMQASKFVYRFTYYYNVSYWMLGTQNGIKAYAQVKGLPLYPNRGPFVNMITSPQSNIAVPQQTFIQYV